MLLLMSMSQFVRKVFQSSAVTVSVICASSLMSNSQLSSCPPSLGGFEGTGTTSSLMGSLSLHDDIITANTNSENSNDFILAKSDTGDFGVRSKK